MGIADPDRLGVIGHSFGGYGVLALLVQTTRFKAAVVSGGYGDRMMVYGALGPDGTAYSIPLRKEMEPQDLEEHLGICERASSKTLPFTI